MASFSALDIMKTAPRKPIEEVFDGMWMPHWSNYLSYADVENLRRIATSKKYAGDMNKKYRMIDNIMKSRGFRRFAGGTNRLVFAHYEDPTILAKVAVDKVGMTDNPYEYNAQVMIKPYCAKMLQVTDCGTVGFAERVLPITSVKEFKLVADDVLDVIMTKIIGKYIVEDIGCEFYMNWGIRKDFGPVLLDYPYIFETEGAKLYCQNVLPNGTICNREIDYDAGFNKLVCLGCGKVYTASDLKKDRAANNIIIRKGGTPPMNVKIVKGDKVIAQNHSSDTIKKPNRATAVKRDINRDVCVSIIKGNEVVTMLKNGRIVNQEDSLEETGYVETESVLDTEAMQVEDSCQTEPEAEEVKPSAISGEGVTDEEYLQSNDTAGGVISDEAAEEEEDINPVTEVSSESGDQEAVKQKDDEEDKGKKELDSVLLSSNTINKYGLRSDTRRIPIGSPFIDNAGEY